MFNESDNGQTHFDPAAEEAEKLRMSLLPCPFCGKREGQLKWGGFGEFCMVICHNRDCGAEGPCKSTGTDAIEGWNMRMPNDVIQGPRSGPAGMEG